MVMTKPARVSTLPRATRASLQASDNRARCDPAAHNWVATLSAKRYSAGVSALTELVATSAIMR